MPQAADNLREYAVARPRRDGGVSLIELLVSVVLIGTVMIALLATLRVTIVGARVHDAVSQNQRLLAEAADVMTDTEPEQVPYVNCNSNPVASYQSAIDALFPPAGTITISVSYWDENTGQFGSTCRYATGHRLQEVTLRSVVDDVTRDVVVVKRPTDTPTASTVPAPPIPPYAGGSGQAVVSPSPGIDGP